MIQRIALFLIITVFFWQSAYAQQFQADINLVETKHFYTENEFQYYQGTNNSQQVFKTKQTNAIVAYNPLTMMLQGAMLFYQNVLSAQFSKSCPYEITCSNFCKASIQQLGLVKGLVAGADRVMRCNRIGIMDISMADINQVTGKVSDSPDKYK